MRHSFTLPIQIEIHKKQWVGLVFYFRTWKIKFAYWRNQANGGEKDTEPVSSLIDGLSIELNVNIF